MGIRSAYKNLTEKPVKVLSAACHAISQGASTASSVAFSLIPKTGQLLPSAIIASALGVADMISTGCFQGKAIINGVDSKDRPQEMVSLRDPLPNTSAAPAENLPQQQRYILPQLLYIALDTSKTLANRYFLLDTLCTIFSYSMNPAAFASIIIMDTLLRESFGMTNETYEAAETIAGLGIDKEEINDREFVPFYKRLLEKFSNNPTLVKFFKLIGVAEHVLVDDTLPWLAFLPQSAIGYMQDNLWMQILMASLGASVAVPLLALMYAQTYLFEGRHTDENVFGAKEKLHIPLKLARFFERTMPLMGVFHGAGAAAPLYVVLRDNIEGVAKWPVAIGAGVFSFGATTNGVIRSEVKEAMKELKESIGRNEARSNPSETTYATI